ncbi:hypothetical protein MKX03_006566, partial [Papaver bracteatum]
MEAFHLILQVRTEMMSPKRACCEYRNVPVERNSFTSPVNDRLLVNSPKPKLPPYLFLQSAFASPNRPNSGGWSETCAETGIKVIFRTVRQRVKIRG